jgi:F-type H+-transporting ATPase subunit b
VRVTLLSLLILLLVVPFVAASEKPQPGDVAHGAEKATQKQVHPEEQHGSDTSHAPKTYFGIPGWILKIVNMVLFIGLLVYLLRGPVKNAFLARGEAIRKANEEARERRARADQMAADIQKRLTQIEQDVVAIRERAQAEGERQKKELLVAAEAEAAKILQAARNEVDNRLKSARQELTEYAGQLASERAEALLRERITDADKAKLFSESLSQIEGTR